jgi:hypothetical protein
MLGSGPRNLEGLVLSLAGDRQGANKADSGREMRIVQEIRAFGWFRSVWQIT